MPTAQRHTCCYCAEIGSSLFLFDLGTGVCRFAEQAGQRILEKYDDINILLSHYHLDHIIGLIFLPACFQGKNVRILAPGKPLYPQTAAETLKGLVRPPYFSLPLDQFPMELQVTDIVPGKQDINKHCLESIQQPHSDPSLGFKIDNTLAYITDTRCNEETAAFIQETRVVLHEVWFDTQDFNQLSLEHKISPAGHNPLAEHSDIDSVTRMIADASVEFLIPIHLNPTYSEERLAAMVAHAGQSFTNTLLPEDGKTLFL